MDDARWTERLEGPAEVHAYGRVFSYRHMGRGTPLLLLPPPEDPWRVASGLVRGLADHYRLVVPDTEGMGTDPTCWLACFLDGLGVRGVGVVAAECFGGAIADLASRDPGQVGRVVVVEALALSRPPVPGGPLGARLRASALLLAPGALEVPDTLARLVDFLGDRPLAPA